MRDVAIRVENLGKRYRIGGQGDAYGTLRDAITRTARAPRDALRRRAAHRGAEEFWALRDISFDVKRGEVLGVIGRNGAGKSTLLKILSRVIRPTEGRAVVNGRVGSLLEVGTGFHPELSGRENIYLNAAILGMKRSEVRSKFDDIVEFAEIETFLDTPVKRYSSGMYTRLAFAVAAHLEPEILIVDEVLAVGDSAFQEKCLGKMRGIARDEGRTILFVSHNMDAIQRLCSRSLLLSRGALVEDGASTSIVMRYLSRDWYQGGPGEWIDVRQVEHEGSGQSRFTAVHYSSCNAAVAGQAYADGPLEFMLEIESASERTIGSLAVFVRDQSGTKLVNADTVLRGQRCRLQRGRNVARLRIEALHLNPGTYVVGLWLADPLGFEMTGSCDDYLESAFELTVVDADVRGLGMRPRSDGLVTCPFTLVEVN